MKKKIIPIIIFIILSFVFVNISYCNYESYYDYSYNKTEKIYNYDENIYIDEDGSMDVEEIITVYAGGNKIKRGIYRDFPTRYQDKFGNNVSIKFDVTEVLKDGEEETYKKENITDGVRIYIGDEDEVLDKGEYTYTIKYHTDRQLGFYDDYDEIYWNAIGTGWEFAIDGGTTTVHFPEKVEIIEDNICAYTGAYGSKGESGSYYYFYDEETNSVEFTLIDSLRAGEGFTISVGFEKGAIKEPDFKTKLMWFLQDNIGGIFAGIAFIFIAIWQYSTWKKYGKDPEKSVIIPRYYPPEGLEPEDVKYIDKIASTNKAFEATIMNIAVKGYFKFEKEKGKMVIVKTDKKLSGDLTDFEREIYNSLDDKTKLQYSASLQSKLERLKIKQQNNLKKKHEGKMFLLNGSKAVASIIISMFVVIISIIIGISVGERMSEVIFGIIELSISLGIIISIGIGIKKLHKAKKNILKIIAILVSVPVVLFLILLSYGIILNTRSISTISISLILISNIIYLSIIKTYTIEGRKIKDEIEGFKLFINTVEGDEGFEKTPEMFDKYFPYAYVLGLQNKWANKFEEVLKIADYTPTWCSSSYYVGGRFNAVTFTSGFSSSFSSGISSASTAPGSSSGSGGGGFSGGGGGRWPEAVAGKEMDYFFIK